MDITLVILAFLLLGALTGLLSGLLGIGGGGVIVPGLVFLFQLMGLPSDSLMHLAAGTSLAVMSVTTSRSLFVHSKHKIEFLSIYKRLAPGVIVGVLLGALLASFLHSRVLSIIFALFILIVAFRTWRDEKTTAKRSGLPGSWGTNAVGLLIGSKSGLLGLGGGAITIPFLTYCQVELRRTLMVSLAVSMTVAIVGTAAFIYNGLSEIHLPAYCLGYVYLPALLPLIIGSFIMVPLGAKWSHALPTVTLQRFFAIFLFIIALHMLYVSLAN